MILTLETRAAVGRSPMAVLIKAEAGDLLIDPKTELITGDSGDAVDFLEYSGEALEIVGAIGVILSN